MTAESANFVRKRKKLSRWDKWGRVAAVVVHAAGALNATFWTSKLPEMKIGPVYLKSILITIAYKIVGGGLFITAMLAFGIIPFKVYITVAWSNVLISLASGIVIVLILYPPAKALYEKQAGAVAR